MYLRKYFSLVLLTVCTCKSSSRVHGPTWQHHYSKAVCYSNLGWNQEKKTKAGVYHHTWVRIMQRSEGKSLTLPRGTHWQRVWLSTAPCCMERVRQMEIPTTGQMGNQKQTESPAAVFLLCLSSDLPTVSNVKVLILTNEPVLQAHWTNLEK